MSKAASATTASARNPAVSAHGSRQSRLGKRGMLVLSECAHPGHRAHEACAERLNRPVPSPPLSRIGNDQRGEHAQHCLAADAVEHLSGE